MRLRRDEELLRDAVLTVVLDFFDVTVAFDLDDEVERAETAVVFFFVGVFLRVAPKESEAEIDSVISRTKIRCE